MRIVSTPEARKRKKDSLKAKAWSRIHRKKSGDVRVGKTGTVRLKGKALEELRFACFERDRWHCVECGRLIGWGRVRSTSKDIVTAIKALGWTATEADWMMPGHMAHIHAKRNGGDVLSNVRTLCLACHHKEHSYGKAMQKPCPKRERPA